jgi:hypothetical protein
MLRSGWWATTGVRRGGGTVGLSLTYFVKCGSGAESNLAENSWDVALTDNDVVQHHEQSEHLSLRSTPVSPAKAVYMLSMLLLNTHHRLRGSY